MKELLREYIGYLRSLNYCQSTLKTHKNNIKSFLNWLENNHAVLLTPDLRKEHLFLYQKHLPEKVTAKGLPLRANSINRKITSINGYLKYLAKKGYILRSLSEELSCIKEPKMLPTGVLTHSQVKRILQKIDCNSPLGFRDKTIIELMYSCGLRAGEVVGLNLRSVDFKNATLRVFGKGRKERMVPVGKTALKALETYLKAIRVFMLKDSAEKALFLNQHGTRLQYRVLRAIIKKRSESAKLDENVTPHVLRRTATTELLRSNANMYLVKEFLGHESLDTLTSYAKLTITDLKKMHKKCHPREKDK